MSARAARMLLAAVVGASSFGAHAQLVSCTASATAASFGAYAPFDATARDGTGNIHVRCGELLTLLVSYTIRLSHGASGSYASRVMSSGDSQLIYNLYTNAARSSIWGDGTGATSTVGDSYLLQLFPSGKSYPVYGRIPAGQNVPPGAYTDSIVVTVTY